MEGIKLGTGVLTWNATERRSDRYGTVYLIDDGHNSMTVVPSPSRIDQQVADRWVGQRGDLVAVVKASRDSTHIGDLFRSLYPRTPEVGQVICLGSGLFFTEPTHDGGLQVGVSPGPDDRATDWLNPRALYDAHEQTVDLFFHPVGPRRG